MVLRPQTSDSATACEADDINELGTIDNCYLFGPKMVSYFEAEDYCEKMGLKLPIIVTEAEQTAIETRAWVVAVYFVDTTL